MSAKELRDSIGIVAGNTVGITIWILLFAEKEISAFICFSILLISAGTSIIFIIDYFNNGEDSKDQKRLLGETSPFGFATAISLFLFLFIFDPFYEIIIFSIVMIFITLITYILLKRGLYWVNFKH